MGIETCEGNGVAFLYCSTTMRPINLAAFDDAEEAESFLEYCRVHHGERDVRRLSPETLEKARDAWNGLARCRSCRGRIVERREDQPVDECAGCRTECEWPDGCDARGGVELERVATSGNFSEFYCAEHARAVRSAETRT